MGGSKAFRKMLKKNCIICKEGQLRVNKENDYRKEKKTRKNNTNKQNPIQIMRLVAPSLLFRLLLCLAQNCFESGGQRNVTSKKWDLVCSCFPARGDLTMKHLQEL